MVPSLLHFLQLRFHISDMEKGPVFVSWGLRFLYHMGFVIAWTLIVTFFVQQFGVWALPFFFLFDALFVMIGSGITAFLSSRYHIQTLVYISWVGAIVCIGSAFLFPLESKMFLLFLMIGKGVFFSQLSILLYRKTETLFSRIQAERFFSFIESSITIGSIAGALTLLFSISLFPLPIGILFWILSLSGFLVLFLFSPALLRFVPSVAEPTQIITPFLKTIRNSWSSFSFLSFVSLILIGVSFVFVVTESAFVHHVYENIGETHKTLSPLHMSASVFTDTVTFVHDMKDTVSQHLSDVSARFILHENLAHDLGMFHLFFAILSLLFQIFLTPLLLRHIGVMGTFLSFIGFLFCVCMMLVFGVVSINMFRLFHHTTHSAGESSYHTFYYSFVHTIREPLRLLFEGFIKPFGILIGSITLLFFDFHTLFSVAGIVLLIVFFIGVFARKPFTHISVHTLQSQQDIKEKINAIQVLGQKGHMNAVHYLSEELLKKEEPLLIRERIIFTLQDRKDPHAIHTYIQLLQDPQESIAIKRNVLIALSQFEVSSFYWDHHSFTRYHLLKVLKELFSQSCDTHMKEKIVMSLFRHSPNQESAPFFLETMDSADEHLKSIYLRSCSQFHDREIVFYIKKYLEDPSVRIASHAIIGLWKFEPDPSVLRSRLYEFLTHTDKNSCIAALYALGEVRDRESIHIIEPFLFDTDEQVRLHASIALVKMGCIQAFDTVFELLFCSDEDLSRKTFYMLQRVPFVWRMKIQRRIQKEVSDRVSHVLACIDSDVSSFPPTLQDRLKHWYWISGCYDDWFRLESILSSRSTAIDKSNSVVGISL